MSDFSAVPGSNEQVFLDFRGTTYRVLSVKPYDAGAFTSTLAPIAQTLIGVFQATESRVSKVARVYNPATDTETSQTISEKNIRVTPPVPYTVREVDGSSVLATDFKVFAAARDLDADSPETLFEFQVRR
tara:strand:+ start:4368 stop:4757 length:390 start_codon:yes stop_codon:yes gene_type:complete